MDRECPICGGIIVDGHYCLSCGENYLNYPNYDEEYEGEVEDE